MTTAELPRIALDPVVTHEDIIACLGYARADWSRHFSVVEPGRVRMRRLPGLNKARARR